MEDDKEDETQVGVRMSRRTRDLIERAAKKDNRKLSDWIRRTARNQARVEIGGGPPVAEPDDEEIAILAGLRQVEAIDPALPRSLLLLGSAARTRPPLVRALKELAASFQEGAPPEGEERGRRGPHLVRGKE